MIPHALGPETFTAAGAPWLAHEWLFALGAALGRSGAAWVLFSGGVAACAIVALGLSAAQARRRGASPLAVAICTACAGVALFNSFGVRAQVVAWPLLVGFMLLLECDGPIAWFAVALAAIWSNLHGSAVLAPALGLIVAAGAWLDARRLTPRVARSFGIAVASLAAICLNPFGWRLPAYALEMFHGLFKTNIAEWQPTGIEMTSFAAGALPLLLCIVALGIARREFRRYASWERVLVVAAMTCLLLGAARNVALFALIALPIAATALSRSVRFLAPSAAAHECARLDWIPRVALPCLAMAVAVSVAAALLRAEARPNEKLAIPALRALAAQPGTHRVLCTDFAWCGLLVGAKGTRVFLDGRADPYPARVWDAYLEITRLRPAWRRTLDAYGVDTVVAARDGPLDQALMSAGGWRAGFGDPRYRLWLRAGRPRADTGRDGGA